MRRHLTAPAQCIFEMFDYSKTTGYRLIREGTIPTIKNGSRKMPVPVARIEEQLGVGPGDLDERIDAWFAERA